jgi:hypothetical protein
MPRLSALLTRNGPHIRGLVVSKSGPLDVRDVAAIQRRAKAVDTSTYGSVSVSPDADDGIQYFRVSTDQHIDVGTFKRMVREIFASYVEFTVR